MKIKNNKSLSYTKIPGCSFSGTDKFETDTSKMYLVLAKRRDTNELLLKLKTEDTECFAHIKAIDTMGVRDLDLIENELERNFTGHSYEEILNTDFKPKASRL